MTLLYYLTIIKEYAYLHFHFFEEICDKSRLRQTLSRGRLEFLQGDIVSKPAYQNENFFRESMAEAIFLSIVSL